MEKVLMRGNDAIAEAAIRAGCRFYAGYPITPQNEIPEYMARRMPDVGGVFIQAESEIAAISMVYGAACAGARAMTSSSGPGISLKQEGISYASGAELPLVFVNITRGGPGLANIAPAQSDYFQATRGGGHGDYRVIVLAPSSVQEAYDLTGLAFHLADKYRNPAMLLGDGVIGQMMEPMVLNEFKFPELPEKKWKLGNSSGRARNLITSVYLAEGTLEEHNNRLAKKYAEIAAQDTRYEEVLTSDAELVIVGFGTCARISKAAVRLAREKGLKVGLLRPITLWPFPYDALSKVAGRCADILVVEMSLGQLIDDVKIGVQGRSRIHFIGRPGGGIPTEFEILDKVENALKVPAAR
ncbi:MAG: 3-methyl-2-oxobutanoate dehydrogenase subunit VorB [Candidatus Eisenbacteria bacterium]|nr:3-methyl-2-oxobutanoate dehydrogenase subunit VorB [Candidatus Eisenbacteria bacterium]